MVPMFRRKVNELFSTRPTLKSPEPAISAADLLPAAIVFSLGVLFYSIGYYVSEIDRKNFMKSLEDRKNSINRADSPTHQTQPDPK